MYKKLIRGIQNLDMLRILGHDVEYGTWDDNGCDRIGYLEIDGMILVKNSKIDFDGFNELLDKMEIRITCFIGKMEFVAEASTISEAYDYVKAIIKANELNFPQQEETLSEYMALLVGIKNGNVTSHENHILKVERIAS